ncbi:hypothetical protein PQR71_12335 [Paraburkholderia fungorum]|uniref:hypothetical protein n=1 Tax=Paraburkholderia fungorum TaxID=134537 RepID=UPI0038BA0B23
MAAKRKSAVRTISPSGTPTPLDNLQTHLAPISIALTEELAALLATVLDDGRKETFDRLSQALSDAVPEFLQRAFEQELLAGGKSASKFRASFVAVLRATHRQTLATNENGSTDCAVGGVSCREDAPVPRTALTAGEERNSCYRQTDEVNSHRFGDGSW